MKSPSILGEESMGSRSEILSGCAKSYQAVQILPSSFVISKEELFSNQRMFHTFPHCRRQWGQTAVVCLELFFFFLFSLQTFWISQGWHLSRERDTKGTVPLPEGLPYNPYYVPGHAWPLLDLEIVLLQPQPLLCCNFPSCTQLWFCSGTKWQ